MRLVSPFSHIFPTLSLSNYVAKVSITPPPLDSAGPAQFPTHHHSLTSSVLRGPSLLAIPPIAFVKADESQAVLILHLGRSLCGHDGIVHGGLVATVFDEALGRNVSSTLGLDGY